jgi:hypothetical protein
MKPKIILLSLALGAIIAPAVTAQILDLNISGEIRLGRRQPPPPPAVVVVVPDTGPRGPSPWERGRWYQRTQGYYYYPGGDVYYRPGDRMWFYLERGQWRSGRNLPDWVSIDFGHSITLTMATDRPYAFHQQVVARYPSNYFGARVRVRDDDRRDHGNDNRGPDRNKDNRGRDNDRDRDKRK